MWLFAYKSYLHYRSSHNPMANINVYFGLALGVGLFWYGVPVIFTRDPNILLITYYLTTFFVQLSLLIVIWFVWFAILRNKIRLRMLMIPAILIVAAIMVLEVMTSGVTVDSSAIPVQYIDIFTVAVLKSIMYIGVGFSIGGFYLVQGAKQAQMRAKFRLVMFGLVFILISGATAWSSLVEHGRDTVAGSYVDIVMFIFFLLVIAIPMIRSRSLPNQPTQV